MSIALDQVTKRYQSLPVVNDVSLEIQQGEFLVLLGPSGSGKSTLLRAIAGLVEVDHGRVSLHGRDVTGVSARNRGVIDWDYYRKFMSVNMDGALVMTRACYRQMQQRGGGAIVNQSSTAAYLYFGFYGLAKVDVNGLTRQLAARLGGWPSASTRSPRPDSTRGHPHPGW